MATVHTEVSGVIDAPPATVYAVLSDYRNTHPQILPKPYFTFLTVDQGGQGAGTVFRTQVSVMGVKTDYHMAVSEPQPGRLLVETDAKAGVTTTFTVDPEAGGTQTRLTIATDWTPRPGIRGWIEKMATPNTMRRIYNEQFELIREFVKGQQAGGGGTGGFA